MIRKMLFAIVCSVSACIVPESSSGNTTALKAKVEKDPSKYISDNGKGVAFVKCARDDSFFGGPNEMARVVVEGCDAALTAALARFPEILDVDPVVVEGTTAGYMVLYVPAGEPTQTPTPTPKPEPTPTSVPVAVEPYNP
jgi:hypothetical protein